MHLDRCDAVAERFAGRRKVIGIEISSRSVNYNWEAGSSSNFQKITLFDDKLVQKQGTIRRAWRTFTTCLAERGDHIFLCHYEHPATFITAVGLRLAGKRVYTMGDSKFDDYQRSLWRELGKWFFNLPYSGAMACGRRSRDYRRFLGVASSKISGEYNTISIERIRKLSGSKPAPAGVPFMDRHFTIVARFVPKKNLISALEAYSLYRRSTANPRQLHLCGSGPLEYDLRQKVADLGLEEHVVFHGYLQSNGVAKVLARTLALILPSIEEQFGLVVIEAQAMGLPVILSDACGARDSLVRTGVNGFVVEPENSEGTAYFMEVLSRDQQLWDRMCLSAQSFSEKGDVTQFAQGVEELV